jgi:hypothetical protein
VAVSLFQEGKLRTVTHDRRPRQSSTRRGLEDELLEVGNFLQVLWPSLWLDWIHLDADYFKARAEPRIKDSSKISWLVDSFLNDGFGLPKIQATNVVESDLQCMSEPLW